MSVPSGRGRFSRDKRKKIPQKQEIWLKTELEFDFKSLQ